MRRRSLKVRCPLEAWRRPSPSVYAIAEPDDLKAKALVAELRAAGKIAYIRPHRPDQIEVIR
jgi:hypothetical protein